MTRIVLLLLILTPIRARAVLPRLRRAIFTSQKVFAMVSSLLVFTGIVAKPLIASDIPSDFVIDPTQSYITMSGNTTFGTSVPFEEQFLGSLTTELSGDIFADTGSPSAIVVEPASSINLVNQPTLAQPGNVAAQFAAQIPNYPTSGATSNIAFSNIAMGTSLSTTQEVGGVLTTNQIGFNFAGGLASISAPGLFAGTAGMTVGGTNSANPGSLQPAGAGERMVIPLAFNGSSLGTNLHFTGQIVAHSSTPPGGPGGPFTVVENINTGFDSIANTKLTDGALDQKYVLGPGTTAPYAGQTPFAWENSSLPSTYVPDAASNKSAWITVSNAEISPGPYFFNVHVDLTGFNAATAFLKGFQYAADNELYEVIINQKVVYTNPASQSSETEEFHNFINLGDLGLGAFHSGINTIQFEVLNFERVNASVSVMAFRAEGAVVAETPEPSSLVLAALGFVALAAWRLRRR
jgi:MYXO-CTERM domain-containing protein